MLLGCYTESKELMRLHESLCTLDHSRLTVSSCLNAYAASSFSYRNHSQNEENGEGDESGSHLMFLKDKVALKTVAINSFCWVSS